MNEYTQQTIAARIRKLQATRGSWYRMGETCPTCRQPVTDMRHAHPHDYSGTAEDMLDADEITALNLAHETITGALRKAIVWVTHARTGGMVDWAEAEAQLRRALAAYDD